MNTPGPNEGEDATCWLPRVCPSCGRLADSDPPTQCNYCGTEIPDDQAQRPITS